MGCLFALMAGIFPRLALFIVWVALGISWAKRPELTAALHAMTETTSRRRIGTACRICFLRRKSARSRPSGWVCAFQSQLVVSRAAGLPPLQITPRYDRAA